MMGRTARRTAIFATNFGRTAGWNVYSKGSRVLGLDDARWEDMFWYSYLPNPDEPRFFTHGFWESGVEIRSRVTGEPVVGWFVSFIREERRINIRALWLDPGFPRWPMLWERFAIRKWHRS